MSPTVPPTAVRLANSPKPLLPTISSPATRPSYLSMSPPSRPRASPLAAIAAAGGSSASPSLLAADPNHRDAVLLAARGAMANCLGETHLDLVVPGLRLAAKGKVRDVYESGEHLVLVTTDRQSAFDRVLASIPFKGQVLNETSLWWFNRTRHITPNAVVSCPDKNVTIAKRCTVFPVEFVVRGFVTGSTDTSLWTVYNNGVRNYCGNAIPDGMVKNQKLVASILTPTTKAADHDVPITPDEIVKSGLMSKDDFDEARSKALSLFEYGQQVALKNGVILVDTKYEFGKTADGTIMLIDEYFCQVHASCRAQVEVSLPSKVPRRGTWASVVSAPAGSLASVDMLLQSAMGEQVELLHSQHLSVASLRLEEVVRPLHEVVDSLHGWLLAIGGFLERAEAPLGRLSRVPADPLVGSDVGKVGASGASLYGCFSPRATSSSAVAAPVMQIMPELLELCGGKVLPFPVEEVKSDSREIAAMASAASQATDFVKSGDVDVVVSPSPDSDSHVVPRGDAVAKSGLLTPVPGAIVAREVCDFLATLAVAYPRSSSMASAVA